MSDKFNPSLYVINLKGKSYLPALPRIQWLRSEHPNWGIKTELVMFDKEAGFALVKATILDESGKIVAESMKSQRKTQFLDYIEKAETGAISRACAIAGYGTLMAADMDEVETNGVAKKTDPFEDSYGTTEPR